MASLADLPGLSRTTPEFRAALVQLARDNDLDPDKIGAVIAIESGFRANDQNARGERALGLIQFWKDYFPELARAAGMNVSWDDLRTMSATEQLPLVMAYFRLRRLKASSSATDYLVATFLPSQIGKPSGTVLALRGSSDLLPGTKLKLGTIYASNPTYDTNGDGVITVGDLQERIEGVLDAAATRLRIPVDDDAELPLMHPAPPSSALGLLFGFGAAFALALVSWR